MVLPSWAERFIPHMLTSATGLVVKLDKDDCFVFDGSYHTTPFAAAVNDFSNKKNEPKISFGTALDQHLNRVYSLRISYPLLEILLFDDNA